MWSFRVDFLHQRSAALLFGFMSVMTDNNNNNDLVSDGLKLSNISEVFSNMFDPLDSSSSMNSVKKLLCLVVMKLK